MIEEKTNYEEVFNQNFPVQENSTILCSSKQKMQMQMSLPKLNGMNFKYRRKKEIKSEKGSFGSFSSVTHNLWMLPKEISTEMKRRHMQWCAAVSAAPAAEPINSIIILIM